MDIIIGLADWLWANVLGYLLLGVGIIFSILLKFPQFKYFKKSWKDMFANMKRNEEGASGFGVMMAALGGQIGTGSLVGVASALMAGGPGALFWMRMTAIFGMVITYSEAILGQVFRKREHDGNLTGGPAYYIKEGLGLKIVPILISILYILGIGIAIASLQSNSISQVFTGVLNINPIFIGIIVAILALLVIAGGANTIFEVAGKLVPFMGVAYIISVIIILILNISSIPQMFLTIFEGAFSSQSVAGGIIGWTVADAFRNGMARGMFSNDAGNGSVAIMHASAEAKHPVDQGLLAMLGTFITTIIICTATGLAILSTGVLSSGNQGVLLLQSAFETSFGKIGAWIVVVATILFCFTTLIADMRYGEANITYIFRDKDKFPIIIYRIILLVMLIISSTTKLDFIWSSIDITVGLIVLINVISMLFLFKYVRYVHNDYFKKSKDGKDPSRDYDIDIIEEVK